MSVARPEVIEFAMLSASPSSRLTWHWMRLGGRTDSGYGRLSRSRDETWSSFKPSCTLTSRRTRGKRLSGRVASGRRVMFLLESEQSWTRSAMSIEQEEVGGKVRIKRALTTTDIRAVGRACDDTGIPRTAVELCDGAVFVAPGSVGEIIRVYGEGRLTRSVLKRLNGRASIDWQFPLDERARVFCVGMNFKSHCRELGRSIPGSPSFFYKTPAALVSHRGVLRYTEHTSSLDYEGEVAAVLGKPVSCGTEAVAKDAIFGLTAFLDGSVREYQAHSLFAGKNFFRSGAIGPKLVACRWGNAWDNIELHTTVNGVVRQSARLDDAIFAPGALIAYLSRITPLYPGDVIALGTPAGVGMASDPPRWLKPGDEVAVAVCQRLTLEVTVGSVDESEE